MGRGDDFSIGRDVSNPQLLAAADQYRQQTPGIGRPAVPLEQIRNAVADPGVGRRIAGQYLAAPAFDEAAVPHYQAFVRETGRQFDHMTRPRSRGGLGIDVNVTTDDPYKRARDMISDVRDNHRINVFDSASTGGHPFLTNDQNNMFRAVHDVFGHAAIGRGFDASGEEAAFQHHSSMYTPLAREAMTTETRGQNSTVNFGPEPGVFPQQKVAILPGASRVQQPRTSHFEEAVNLAQQKHAKFFG